MAAMARRVYRMCGQCKAMVIVAGTPRKRDKRCPHGGRARQPTNPTVYYENAAGDIWSGPDADTKCPLPGYQRFEVQPHEIRAFERKQNRRMQKDHYDQLERHGEASDFHAKHRADVRRELDAEILTEAQGWDAEHRAILHHAMEHRDDPTYTRNYDAEFHIGAYS